MALEDLRGRKGRWKLCWKAFVAFENQRVTEDYFFPSGPSIVEEPAVVRRLDCYTNHEN